MAAASRPIDVGRGAQQLASVGLGGARVVAAQSDGQAVDLGEPDPAGQAVGLKQPEPAYESGGAGAHRELGRRAQVQLHELARCERLAAGACAVAQPQLGAGLVEPQVGGVDPGQTGGPPVALAGLPCDLGHREPDRDGVEHRVDLVDHLGPLGPAAHQIGVAVGFRRLLIGGADLDLELGDGAASHAQDRGVVAVALLDRLGQEHVLVRIVRLGGYVEDLGQAVGGEPSDEPARAVGPVRDGRQAGLVDVLREIHPPDGAAVGVEDFRLGHYQVPGPNRGRSESGTSSWTCMRMRSRSGRAASTLTGV